MLSRFNAPRVLLLLLTAFGLLSPCARAAEPSPRQHVLMDAGWRFQLAAPAVLSHAGAVNSWRWRSGQASEAVQVTAPNADTSGADWKDIAAPGPDVFGGKPGFAWFRAALPDLAGPRRTLHFESVDDNATVFLNGKQLLRHEVWNEPFDVPLDTAWKPGGPNVVAVLVENTAGAGGIAGAVTLGTGAGPTADPSAFAYDDHAWRVVHLPHDYVLESAFTPKGDASHGSLIPTPAWYRKTFTLPAVRQGQKHSGWILTARIGTVNVYLNGTLLGEHPCGYTPFRFDISQDCPLWRAKMFWPCRSTRSAKKAGGTKAAASTAMSGSTSPIPCILRPGERSSRRSWMNQEQMDVVGPGGCHDQDDAKLAVNDYCGGQALIGDGALLPVPQYQLVSRVHRPCGRTWQVQSAEPNLIPAWAE